VKSTNESASDPDFAGPNESDGDGDEDGSQVDNGSFESELDYRPDILTASSRAKGATKTSISVLP
jgi:hypothetical protein